MPSSQAGSPLKVTKELLLEIGGWRAMKEGRALFESGKVESFFYEPPMLYGTVKTGTSSVKARLHLGNRLSDVENLCSCRQAREYGTICPHVIALGLAYMESNQALPSGQAISRLIDQASPRSVVPKLNVVPLSEASESTSVLELNLLLPIKFVESWNTGEMRVICEGSVDGGKSIPISNFCDDGETYAVSESDAQLLSFIQEINDGEVPSMWMLSSKYFGEFLVHLIGHSRVKLGKKSQLNVVRAPRRSKLYFKLQEDGELHLHMEKVADPNGKVLQSTAGQWCFIDDKLEHLNGLSVGYLALRQKDVLIERKNLAHFFQHEIPLLERQVDLEMDERCKELEFEKVQPEIQITLDGMLSGISCKVEAIYDDETYVLQGNVNTKNQQIEKWKPDVKNPLRYFIRDRVREVDVKSEILNAGFAPGQRQPEFYTLSSESRVGFFLANILPKWSLKWKIVFSPRMNKFMDKCDLIEPEITIKDETRTGSGNDWLSMDLEFKEDSGKTSLDPAEIQKMLNSGVSHQRTASGRIALIPTQSISEFQEVIRDCDVEQTGKGIQIDRKYADYLGEAFQSNGWNLTARSNWKPPDRLKEFETLELWEPVKEMVRSYQNRGISWLHYLASNGMCGILADEMGLGKTLQTLIYLLYRKRNQLSKESKPYLVICPTSVVGNWKDEVESFTPDLKVLVLHGSKRKELFDQINKSDLVVTSYALLRRDIERYGKFEFDTVILDEGQYIKNRGSQNAKCVKMLKSNYRLVLTGTPIENSLFDLWSIFDFLMPGYLGTATDFRDRYEVPISKFKEEHVQARLKQRVRPFVLRRTKSEVAQDLPEKMEQVVFCDLSLEQKQMYQSILNQGRKNLFEQIGKKGNGKSRLAVLTTLMRLRQVCCHLELLPQVKSENGKTIKNPSAKMEYFLEFIRHAVEGGHRILVFSQFVSMLRLVQENLKQSNLEYCYLDGTSIDRQKEVKRFQENSKIPLFLISLKAGGTGLNLTGADTVVHFDPWWNPAVEDQATARAHRIGQTRIVSSYKLIARGTVEEKIVNLQKKKKDLVANTLVSEETFVQSLTWNELQGLLE